MQVAGKRVIHAAKGQTYRLHVIGDVHLGNAGCAEDRFRERVEQIASDPCALWIGVGDYVDAVGFRDKRFDPEGISPDLTIADLADLGRVQFRKASDILKPIARKCIGVGYGNHEDALMHHENQRGLWLAFVASLGNPADLGYCAFLDLVFRIGQRDHSYRIATHHGAGFAMTAGGKLNRLRSFLEAFAADLVLTGHTHERLDHQLVVLAADANCEHLAEVVRLGVVCGSWLRTYTEGACGYGERKGYRPGVLGNPAVTIQPETRAMGTVW